MLNSSYVAVNKQNSIMTNNYLWRTMGGGVITVSKPCQIQAFWLMGICRKSICAVNGSCKKHPAVLHYSCLHSTEWATLTATKYIKAVDQLKLIMTAAAANNATSSCFESVDMKPYLSSAALVNCCVHAEVNNCLYKSWPNCPAIQPDIAFEF